MRKSVRRSVRNCHTCSQSNTSRHAPFGALRPLPVPQKPWTHRSMNFGTGLRKSNNKDDILVVVDRLSKMKNYLACHTTTGSEDPARLFIDYVLRLYVLPMFIVSDRGTQFTSRFSKSLCKALKITAAMSSSFHPETDGQME